VHRICAPLPFELPVHPWPGARFNRLFAALRPEVVHVHVGTISPFAWQAIHACLRRNLPLVVTVHSMWDPLTQASYRLAPWNTRVLMTAVSHAAAALVRTALPRQKVTVVPNGIDTGTWRPDLTTPQQPERIGVVRVLAVGRLAPRKKPIQLLRLISAAHARLGPSHRLRATIVGDGPSLPIMRRYAHNRGLDGVVRLTGRLERSRVRDLLATTQLFLAPARLEAFGLAALEARTAGVPVIARSGNGIADFVRHGREGVLCSRSYDLVDAIVTLSSDRSRRMRMAAHNRSTEPSHCSWPTVLANYDDCYAEAARTACSPHRAR
jgi:phosphatidylinositol alpha 1,6-mannosyltransferase